MRAPTAFGPDEMPDRAAIGARFGGGRYDVIARDAHKIVGRARVVIEGPPLPLNDAQQITMSTGIEIPPPEPNLAAAACGPNGEGRPIEPVSP